MSGSINKSEFNTMEEFVSIILDKNVINYPDEPAIICENVVISFHNLKNLVSKIVSLLEEQNLPKQIVIGLRFHNPINYCIFYLVLFKMGIAQTSVSPYDTTEIQLDTIKTLNIDLIIQDFSPEVSLPMPIIKVYEDFSMQTYNMTNIKENINLPNGTSVVFLGSGTTGKKKIISRTSKDFVRPLNPSIYNYNMEPKDRYFSYTKIFYSFARRGFLRALLFGITFVLSRNNPKNLIEFCIENKINHISLTASQARIFLLKNNKKLQLPLLKSCVLTSSIITEPIRDAILSTITKNLYILYGTNEFGVISIATPEDVINHKGTVGRAIPGISLKILNDSGEECSTREVGNIVVEAQSMMTQYHNDLETTNNTFKAQGYYTGDLGQLTEDGNLIFEGRSDDMMIFTGVNIYPRELESLLESHPCVKEAAVFPMVINEEPDVPCAAVTLKEQITSQEIMHYCEKSVQWRSPKIIIILDELPRNSMGKVQKNILKQTLISMYNKS